MFSKFFSKRLGQLGFIILPTRLKTLSMGVDVAETLKYKQVAATYIHWEGNNVSDVLAMN